MATTANALPRITMAASIMPSGTDSHLDQVRLSDVTLITEQSLPCQINKVDLWFAETPREQQQAKHLCGGCPIRLRCLAGALHRRESCGIWGGEIFYKGTIVAHQPTRGRPRIHLTTNTTHCDRTHHADEPHVDNARNQTDSPKADPRALLKTITTAHGREKVGRSPNAQHHRPRARSATTRRQHPHQPPPTPLQHQPTS